MPMRLSALRASLGAVVLLAGQAFLGGATATASGAPPTITADMPSAIPAGHNWSYNDYFPRTMTVRQGTTVDFALLGFHTATLLPTGTTAAADMLQAGLVSPDETESDRNPNGTTHAVVNFGAAAPPSSGCGWGATPCTFDGSQIVSSGAPAGPAFQVNVSAAPGTYAFHCRIHPGMVGWLNVVRPTDPVPSPSEVGAAVAGQVAADVAAGYAAESLADHQAPHHNADGTMTWNLSAGTASPDGHTVILEMLPRNVHIRKGDSVRWVSPSPNEPHTVTFPIDLGTDFMPAFESPGPPEEIVLAPGNGVSTVTTPNDVSDSGLLASTGEGDAFGLSPDAYLHSWQVSFAGAVPGTYHYVCQIHVGMEGTVTVIPAH